MVQTVPPEGPSDGSDETSADLPAERLSAVDRVDGFQRRHRVVGYPIAVVYKFIDDGGGHLAALLTYYGFLSAFPLLLLASTILGIVLNGDPALQQRLLNSALSEFPVIGQQLGRPGAIGGGLAGLLVGGLGALYGALGVSLAAQKVMNIAWNVPKNTRPNPIKARGRGLLLLGTVGVALLLTVGLSTLSAGAGSFGPVVRVLVLVGSVLVNVGAFVVAFRVATARDVGVRDVLPGAIAAAVLWQLLQSFGAGYVGRFVKGSSDTDGVFAIVLGIIALLYLASIVVVFCVELNVVRVDRLWPRALLTPLTDAVDLTDADQRAYTSMARAQRSKGFEEIDVRYTK